MRVEAEIRDALAKLHAARRKGQALAGRDPGLDAATAELRAAQNALRWVMGAPSDFDKLLGLCQNVDDWVRAHEARRGDRV